MYRSLFIIITSKFKYEKWWFFLKYFYFYISLQITFGFAHNGTCTTKRFTREKKKKTSWCHTVKDRHVDKRQKSDKLQSSREIGVQDVMHSDEKLTVMSSPPCPPQQVNTFIVTAQICIIALTVYLTPQQQYKSEYPPNGSNNRFFFVLPNYESTT